MSEREHIKAIPDGDLIAIKMDRAGYDLFSRVVSRSEPRKDDNPTAHKAAKDRVEGALLAARSQMNWSR